MGPMEDVMPIVHVIEGLYLDILGKFHMWREITSGSQINDKHTVGPTVTFDVILRAERDDKRAESRLRLSPKRTSPFKSVGALVQSTAGSRGVRISLSNSGYTTFGGGVRVPTTHSICQFPLHFPSRVPPSSERAIRQRNSPKYIPQ